MKNDNIDPQVFSLLDGLKPVPERDSHAAARGRARFLTEAVSLRDSKRHSGWMIFPYKEKFAMKIVISALVIVGLLFGGSATVSAAQDDLPNQTLYQVKLMSEDMHLWFTSEPVQQIDLLMEQEQIRLQEMQKLAAEGVIPPTDVAVRAQERIQRALQIASQLDEASRLAKLQQIRMRLQIQEQQMLQLEQGPCAECTPVLRQTREMLQLHLRELENGLKDPDPLQIQTQTQNQDQLRINQTPSATRTAIPPCGTCTPALNGTGQQNGSDGGSMATPVQQQNQTQQQNQMQQQNQGGGGTQNGNGSGGSPNGSGGGSSTGTGGQGGKP